MSVKQKQDDKNICKGEGQFGLVDRQTSAPHRKIVLAVVSMPSIRCSAIRDLSNECLMTANMPRGRVAVWAGASTNKEHAYCEPP